MIEPRDFAAIVVAAGRASRFGGPVPKQFHMLAGTTVLERSVRALASSPAVDAVVVVLAEDELRSARGRASAELPGVERVVAGGATRADSVRAGVEAAGRSPYVLVHDAARPFVSASLIEQVVAATRAHGAAVPVVGIADTVKTVEDGRITGTLPREGLGLAQTPQGSRRDWLLAALKHAAREGTVVTDEASALEGDRRQVAAVPGDRANRKITTVDDLAADRPESAREVGLRVGTGFDVHHVDPGRPLWLGGVLFPDEVGLAGHSDADVVLHAAMDALLGAAGLGDIGVHFPPDDPAFAGAASADLARRVAKKVARAGYRIVNLDLTVLAEAPRIRPRAEAMRRAMADCLGTDPARIGLKATTLERLGALGRREGIACEAVALLVRCG